MKPYIRAAVVLTGLVAFSQPSIGAQAGKSIAMQGNGKGATACVACHGADGSGQAGAGFPALAGMDADYLAKQLNDFKQGTRKNPVMAPVAKALTAEESKAVSKYYSAKTPVAGSKPKVSQSVLKTGKNLAEKGNWPKEIPACFACHGPGATGVAGTFPALAGQHASYITSQIQAWKSGQRSNDPDDLMKAVAERLSDAEIKAVSAYLSSLSAK